MREYILQPKQAVQHALENPSIAKIIALLLLPNVAVFLIALILTFQFHIEDLVIGLLDDFILLVVSSIVLLILTSLFSRQMASLHSFLGIATALSLNGIYRTGIVLVAYLGFPLLVFPGFVQQFQLFLQGKIGQPEALQALTAMLQGFNTFQFALSLILLFIMMVFFLFTIYIYYRTISYQMKSTVLIHLVVLVISLIVTNFILGFI